MRGLCVLLLAAAVSGCDLAPPYQRPAPAITHGWPSGPAYAASTDEPPGSTWQALIGDLRCRAVVAQALANSQSLMSVVSGVAMARAQFLVQRSAEFPFLEAQGGATITRGIENTELNSNQYNANLGVNSFELDLFGRLRNTTKASFEQFLATEAGERSSRIALVANTVTAYVTLASDEELLKVARDSLASGMQSLELTRSLHAAGLDAETDVAQAETIVDQANFNIAQSITSIAQDRNALELLAGGPIPGDLLSTSLAELDRTIGDVPAGISSHVLLARPDVLQAEHQLKGSNASIGAARAAFFPSITLTSGVGVASSALSALFTGGALNTVVSPQVDVPVLGGPNSGTLKGAKAQRDIDLAQYQLAIQTAFREVADALAQRGTIGRQRLAQDRLVNADATAFRLAYAQYRAGTDTFLDALVTQRALYAAQQTQVTTVLADIVNRVSLYQDIGSDFASPPAGG